MHSKYQKLFYLSQRQTSRFLIVYKGKQGHSFSKAIQNRLCSACEKLEKERTAGRSGNRDKYKNGQKILPVLFL